MDNMIHTLNKVTLRNQHKVPRKIKSPRASLASKSTLKQDRPEKKLVTETETGTRQRQRHIGI